MLVATVCLATVMMVAVPTGAVAAMTSCRARNVTKDEPSETNLQVVIDAADLGDTIAVRGVCRGTFGFPQDISIVGHATTAVPVATLNADGSGQVVHVRASSTVTFTDLKITGGNTYGAGSGIYNQGTLTLMDTLVRDNRTHIIYGAVFNAGTLNLSGSSFVRRNRGGGIWNEGTLTMNDGSSVTQNRAGEGIDNAGVLVMNDSSSVSANGILSEITNKAGATTTMNDSSSVSGNTSTGGVAVDMWGGELTMNGSSSVLHNASEGIGILSPATVTMNDTSSVRGNGSGYGGIYNGGTLIMNGASRVAHNTASSTAGGIYNNGGSITLNGSSLITGNVSARGGGGVTMRHGTLILNDSSQITGNTAVTNGGGVTIRNNSALTMNGLSTITGNRMDYNDDGLGAGGGVYCRLGTITGVVKGGNVNDNYRGPTGTRENNVVIVDC